MENYFHLNMDRRAVNQISALGLAHCGDAVFELLVRSFLCASGKALNGNLHRATVDLVCAPAQAARTKVEGRGWQGWCKIPYIQYDE